MSCVNYTSAYYKDQVDPYDTEEEEIEDEEDALSEESDDDPSQPVVISSRADVLFSKFTVIDPALWILGYSSRGKGQNNLLIKNDMDSRRARLYKCVTRETDKSIYSKFKCDCDQYVVMKKADGSVIVKGEPGTRHESRCKYAPVKSLFFYLKKWALMKGIDQELEPFEENTDCIYADYSKVDQRNWYFENLRRLGKTSKPDCIVIREESNTNFGRRYFLQDSDDGKVQVLGEGGEKKSIYQCDGCFEEDKTLTLDVFTLASGIHVVWQPDLVDHVCESEKLKPNENEGYQEDMDIRMKVRKDYWVLIDNVLIVKLELDKWKCHVYKKRAKTSQYLCVNCQSPLYYAHVFISKNGEVRVIAPGVSHGGTCQPQLFETALQEVEQFGSKVTPKKKQKDESPPKSRTKRKLVIESSDEETEPEPKKLISPNTTPKRAKTKEDVEVIDLCDSQNDAPVVFLGACYQ